MEESNLSFHIELQSEKDSKITSLKDNVYFMVTLFIVTNLIHLTAASYLLNIFPLIALLTLRSLYMIIIPLLYSKMFDHTLLNIDMDCTRLLISNAIFLIIAWFTHYYSLQMLPISEAATFIQLVPAQILVFSYLFIQPSNQMIFILSLIQILLTFTFQNNYLVILISNLYPIILSFLYILKQISTKEINPITNLMYTSMLQIPIFILISALMGELQILSNLTLLIGTLILVIAQLVSQLSLQCLIDLLKGDTWSIQGSIIIFALPIQFLTAKISIMSTISQIIIILTSIKLNIK